MKLSPLLIIHIVITFVTLTANADLITIAKVGEPAADFPPDFIYWNLKSSPVIGNGGHIAFAGVADVRITSTEKNQEAVWSGKPGQLHTVIRKDESPEGFLASTVFSAVHLESLVVSDSGSVAFTADMTGSRNSPAYLASVNGTTFGIIQIGNPAPGFPAGTSILTLSGFVFSDAGMAISGITTTSQLAIWFWNNNTLELVLSSGNEFTDLYPGCTVEMINLGDLNQAGEIVIAVDLKFNPDKNCPRRGLFTWKNGIFKKIVVKKDPVPGLPNGSFFNDFSTFFLLYRNRINDNGDVSFFASFSDGHTTGSGNWVAKNNGKIEPVVLLGELLPGLAGKISSLISAGSTLNANMLTVSKITSYEKGEVILAGPSKQGANYTDFSDLGESHLKALAYRELQPPGFNDTWFFNKFGHPLINNRDTIAFWAEIRDSLSPTSSSTRGIWLGDKNGDLRLLLAEGVPTKIDGKNQMLRLVADISQSRPSSSNSGFPNQFNNNDELVFIGAIDDQPLKNTIFYSGKSIVSNDCTSSYKSNGLLNIPCVTVPNPSGGITMYQADMKLIPFSNPVSFELTNAQQGEGSTADDCVSAYKGDGTLNIPCVTVPDNSGNTSTFQAKMELVPQSNPLKFKLIQVK